MFLLFTSFLAGVLTVLAPCVLPLLPIIIGGSIGDGHKWRPYVIAGSLTVSVVAFTLLLKASTLFIAVPESILKSISAGIIIFLGLSSVFPSMWTKAMRVIGFQRKSEEALQAAGERTSLWRDILVGSALGPVFSSCSPTYFLILATVLPVSFTKGTVYLSAYALGLALMLLAIGLLGRKLVSKIAFMADPNGLFRRGLGVLFIIAGVLIFFGIDKKISTYILDHGYFDVTKIETRFFQEKNDSVSLDGAQCTDEFCTNTQKLGGGKQYAMYQEITKPAGFVNSVPFTLKESIGKEIILLDFMTYSCINCIRTFPYLKAWDEKYRKLGLKIVAIHTPEFAFEKKKENVEEAMRKYGLTFPVVLDNDYGTWNAYGNRYWPRKYLIDLDGNIVYDHIGEGQHDETEKKIQQLLRERAERLRQDINGLLRETVVVADEEVHAKSKETYFGYARTLGVENGSIDPGKVVVYTKPTRIEPNKVYLVGPWKTEAEYIEAAGPGAEILFQYEASKIFGVMSPGDKDAVEVVIEKDGEVMSPITVSREDLFMIGEDQNIGEHTIRLIPQTTGFRLFTFTFG
jgi:cytochrome c biogenesis protein CcdA/thiol-disulfide isomerase/thioredoxin